MRNQLSIAKNKSKDIDVYINHSERGDFFIPTAAQLYLADGTTFSGFMPNWQTGSYVGEVVFNTGMTGYVESLTDPSYAGQILVFTYPLIGNYGVRTESAESDKIQVSGVVVNEATLNWSHSGSSQSLLEWLRSQNVPIIIGVDTRALTKHLRTKGASDAYTIRRLAIDNHLPLITNAEIGRLLIRCLTDPDLRDIEPKYWSEYI